MSVTTQLSDDQIDQLVEVCQLQILTTRDTIQHLERSGVNSDMRRRELHRLEQTRETLMNARRVTVVTR